METQQESGGGALAGSGANPRSSAPKSKYAFISGLAAVAVVAALGYRVWRSSSATNVNGTVNAATDNEPAVAGAASETELVAMEKTDAGRQTVGSTSINVPDGLLTRDNPQLNDVFGPLGINVVLARTYSNLDPIDFAPKVQSGELTLEQALADYWRLDIMELTNPAQVNLKEWLGKHWPTQVGEGITLTERDGKLGKVGSHIQQLEHDTLGMSQTVYFAQPQNGGNVVVFSSFQGKGRPFDKQINALMATVKFSGSDTP